MYPSPLVPAGLGSKSVKVGSSRDGFPSVALDLFHF